MENEPAAFSRR